MLISFLTIIILGLVANILTLLKMIRDQRIKIKILESHTKELVAQSNRTTKLMIASAEFIDENIELALLSPNERVRDLARLLSRSQNHTGKG